jgi:hypothetical protein
MLGRRAFGATLLVSLFAVRVASAQVDTPSISLSGTLTLFRGHADVHVVAEVFGEGTVRSSADLQLLAQGAVGNRLALFSRESNHWIEARPWSTERAELRYGELAGAGWGHSHAAWMYSNGPGVVGVSFAPVLPGETHSLTFDVRLPTVYEGGAHWVSVDESVAPLALTPVAGERGTLVGDGGAELAPGSVVRIDVPRRFGLRASSPPVIRGRLALVPLRGRAFARFEVEVAPELAPIPSEPYVIVAIDRSHSMGERGVRAAHLAARAFLSYFPGARVRILHFARASAWHSPEFVAQPVALGSLDRIPELENGSAVDRALADAVAALRGRSGPQRIVLFTDGRMSELLRPDLLARLVTKTSATLHIGVLGTTGATWPSRQDRHQLAPVARRTGGLVWDVSCAYEPKTLDELRPLFEEWVRPARIEHVTWTARGFHEKALPRTLEPGSGVVLEQLVPGVEVRVAVEGELWSKPVRLDLVPSPRESRTWTELALGSDLAQSLTDSEDSALAASAHAVSRTRTLLALEGTATGSGGENDLGGIAFIGADWGTALLGLEGIGDSFGCDGCFYADVAERVAGGLFLPSEADYAARERRMAARKNELVRLTHEATESCGSAPGGALELETTLDEIVDVRLESVPEKVARCVEARAWASRLSLAFDQPSATFRVGL